MRNAIRAIALIGGTALTLAAVASDGISIGFIDAQKLPVYGSGSLKGAVQFIQSHAIYPRGNESRSLPKLVQDRTALLVYIPDAADGDIKSLRIKAVLGGKDLGEMDAEPPSQFPKSDQQELNGKRIEYSTKAWSATLPWQWLKPGVQLRLRTGSGREQTLSSLEFSGPTELVMQHVRIGMLSPAPKATFLETNTAEAAIDYFQKIPVSRLVVSQYDPVIFDRIVLPNGTTYTSASADTGGVFRGDLREDIGKSLVSVGINLANYGIASSAGSSQDQPGYFAQVVIHHSQGRYKNGLVAHGLSGGNGMATLEETTGNEFSHELGHVFGLDHFHGGYEGSVHGPGSGWGYDAHKHRTISNVARDTSSPKFNDGTSIRKFMSRPYGLDAMSGGEPMGDISRYTHHTGYAANLIQKSLASFAVPNLTSSSGYRKWNESELSMTVFQDANRKRPSAVGVPVVTLVGYYDPQGRLPSTIYPAMFGSYGVTYGSDRKEANKDKGAATECRMLVAGSNNREFVAKLDGTRLNAQEMNKFHVNIPMNFGATLASVQCLRAGLWTTLASSTIRASSRFVPRVTQVGRTAGFGAIVDSSVSFVNLVSQSQVPLPSIDELRRKVTDLFGPVQSWKSQDAWAKKGRVYEYLNPENGQYEYFFLKNDGQYGYFPTDQTSNVDWKFIGTASSLVNISPNPFKLRALGKSSADAAVIAYYDKKTLSNWRGDGANVGTPGDIYVYDNPYNGTREYFKLKTSSYSYFPTNKTSNQDWDYLGDSTSVSASMGLRAPFEKSILNWYRKDRFQQWSHSDTSGRPGDIYVYDNPYTNRREYFRLKTASYGYFPVDASSNISWEYLGRY